MGAHSFQVPLDDELLEWIKYRFSTDGRLVRTLTIQYETTDSGERKPVVRFNNAHGFAHRDLLDRNGRIVSKDALSGDLTTTDALNLAIRDISRNWQRYRQAFFEDQQ